MLTWLFIEVINVEVLKKLCFLTSMASRGEAVGVMDGQ